MHPGFLSVLLGKSMAPFPPDRPFALMAPGQPARAPLT